jgi:hypothetical protein
VSRASHALGLLDALFDHPAPSLARVLTIRQVPLDLSQGLAELATALTAPDAVWRHVSQLTSDELRVLLELPDSGDDPLTHSLIDSLLALKRNSQFYPIADIAAIVREHQPENAQTHTVVSVQARDEPEQPDVAGVFDYLEQIETIVDFLEGGFPHPISEGALAKGLEREDLDIDALLDGATRLGLTRRSGKGVTPTAAGSRWLQRGAADKWLWCLEQLIQHLPAWWPRPLPDHVSSEVIQSLAISRYPLVSTSDTERLVTLAHRLGLIRGSRSTVLEGADTPQARSALIESVVPPAVNQLYPDGPDTLVAAGPLDSETTTALRKMSTWLSGELAPRFHIDAASITRALQAGVTPEDIRELLTRTVAVGMAPALLEMVDDTISRATALTLRATPGGSHVTSSDQLTLELIRADRRLQAASFRPRDAGGVESLLGVSQVHELLLSEGYPHLIRDATQSLILPDSAGGHEPTESIAWTERDVFLWRERIAQARAEPGFFEGVIELAISERVPITVTVSMGELTQEMTIEPHALRNGRLRGRDTRSDVERTLPVSHVVGVRADATLS